MTCWKHRVCQFLTVLKLLTALIDDLRHAVGRLDHQLLDADAEDFAELPKSSAILGINGIAEPQKTKPERLPVIRVSEAKRLHTRR